MKRPYTAPALYAENFALCEHIAGCQINGQVTVAEACSIRFDLEEFGTVFLFGGESGRNCQDNYADFDFYFGSSSVLTNS